MTRRFTSDSTSPSKRFQAFEFNADDEVVEKQSTKMIAKFRNLMKPRNRKSTKNKYLDSPIIKYKFLQCFTKNLEKEFRNEPIDVDAGVTHGTKTPQKEITTLLLDDDATDVGTVAEDGGAAREEMPGLDVSVVSSSPNHEKKQVCAISDDDERIEMRSSSTLVSSPSTSEAPLEEQESYPVSGGYEIVETAIGDLQLESRDSRAAANAYKTSGEEAISSLDARYGDVWILDFDFSKPFKDVIYPQGDPDAVCISKRDLQLLQPATFINDTIVDFYIQYLKSKIQPEEKHRFHFFNSFFFRKLADLDKDQPVACEGKEAFQRVLKWTRKVNVFEKDYIFIPVNYRLHWSLIVICHPGEVANVEDEEIESSPKVPCILHMDSIRGSHRGLKNLVQRYLCEEWKEKHGGTAENVSLKFLHLRFFALELPQQENSFDCGLFLLHYVERFLEEAPVEFSPFKKFSNFLNKNWFPPADASVKRFQIKKLICKILEDHSQETLIDDCIDKDPSSQRPNKTHKEETGIKFPEEMPSPTKTFDVNSSSSNACGIKTSLLEASPPIQIAARNLSLMSPIKEVEDTGDQIADSSVDMEDREQGSGSDSESYFFKGLSISKTSSKHRFSKHIGDAVAGNPISQTSSADCLIMENEAFDYPRKTDTSESSSSDDLTACVVLDSEEENDNEVQYLSSTLEDQPSFHEVTDSTKIINPKEIMPLSSKDPVSDSSNQQASKRLRLTLRVDR
ncbi:putative ubiquitin-like-specific protease 2B isoform X1 [Prunus yedoensis var. nudiflora]|uniref:Putative ubiquitin-like-specific protease 2B isoform X1 n=1 Tax=Prunus yedoensis var. nudiflora TaxID=2094558 RepID=A0A314XPX1_PRUYE|nr:putative ubiquitin-like-specific protease 2B isoform X1 [Prunus yedoensis var. nudiflora]